MKRILHLFSTISHLGGVESILRLHARLDKTAGWESLLLIACESDEACRPYGAIGLGIRGWDTIATLRRRFARAYASFQPDVVVFHNLWAARHLIPETANSRRIAMLHTASPEAWLALTNCREALDTVIVVSPQFAERARQVVGSRIPVDIIEYPIDPPPAPVRKVTNAKPFVVGYAGRIVREQKRCDRLVRLIDETLKTSTGLRFEIMGSGADEAEVRGHFQGNSSVAFPGRQEGEAYWRHLQGWDAIVLTSDYEGSPLSLVVLEAMSQGVLPLFPRIDSGGDATIEQIDPTLLYDKEDLTYAANKLISLSRSPAEALEPLRARAMTLTLRFRPEIYLKDFFSRLEAESPAPTKPATLRASFAWTDLVPFFVLKKYMTTAIY